jgi:hypothetical protein
MNVGAVKAPRQPERIDSATRGWSDLNFLMTGNNVYLVPSKISSALVSSKMMRPSN